MNTRSCSLIISVQIAHLRISLAFLFERPILSSCKLNSPELSKLSFKRRYVSELLKGTIKGRPPKVFKELSKERNR